MRSMLAIFLGFAIAITASATPAPFLENHCYDCHDEDTSKGDLDLTALPIEISSQNQLDKWVKVFDRIHAGEMPPKKKPRPDKEDSIQFLRQLS